jgi:hypothetical protein
MCPEHREKLRALIQPWADDEKRIIAVRQAEERRKWRVSRGYPEDEDEYNALFEDSSDDSDQSAEDDEEDYIVQDDEPSFDGALDEFGEYGQRVYEQVRNSGVGHGVSLRPSILT